MSFSIGGPLQPCAYRAPLWRYGASATLGSRPWPASLRETDLSSAKQNVVEFMLDTREQLRSAVDQANEVAAQQRTKSKTWYNKRAVNPVSYTHLTLPTILRV